MMRKIKRYIQIFMKFKQIWKIRNLLQNSRSIYARTRDINLEISFMSEFSSAMMTNDSQRISAGNIERLVWVVPPASEYGGGFRTISRFINKFSRIGINQVILIHHPFSETNVDIQKEIWQKTFGISPGIPIEISSTKHLRNSIVIATGWQTLPFVIRFVKKPLRAWFMQDLETQFHVQGSTSLAIGEMFKEFDLAMTAGPWLAKICKENGIKDILTFEFGIDEVYFQNSSLNETRNRNVVCYFQIEKEWRASLFLLEILKISLAKFPDWTATLVGDQHAMKMTLPKNITAIGRLSPIQLSYHYAESSIGLCVSLTNASLIPFEMLASGIPVLTNEGVNNEWLSKEIGSNLIYAPCRLGEFSNTFENLMQNIENGWKPESIHLPIWEDVIDDFFESVANSKDISHELIRFIQDKTSTKNFKTQHQ